ncbi:MAG: nucleotidyltransferase domain-containing protein [Candidatus Omnitrophota bacterium]|nr:nucleotidyltransferase domain-containing protein [Candidatus Omnitrophota bacterium]
MEIKKVLREFKVMTRELYGRRLKEIILYGSWARNEATQDLDIDLLIILKGKVTPGREIDKMIDIITELNLKYGVLLAVYPVRKYPVACYRVLPNFTNTGSNTPCEFSNGIYPVSEEEHSFFKSPLLMNVRREGVPA